jgi:hypothetical protein
MDLHSEGGEVRSVRSRAAPDIQNVVSWVEERVNPFPHLIALGPPYG